MADRSSGMETPFPWMPPTRQWHVEDDAEGGPPFYEMREVFPFLSPLVREWRTVAREVITVTGSDAWTPWPETTLWRPELGHDWRVIPFLHTFPADDASRSVWIDSSCKRFPATVALLRRVPGVRTALLSRLGPKTSLSSHQGWAQLSNHVLRCHIGIVVPDAASRLSGVVVDDEIRHHSEGGTLVFDDSHIHSAFNNHPTSERVVLIIDVARPAGVPPGIAIGGTTAELEAFMQYFH